MSIIEALIQELEQEAQTTRRVLARVPGDRLSWKPHAKSMSLGQLALHVAMTPGGVSDVARQLTVQRPLFIQPAAESTAQVMTAFEESIVRAKANLRAIGDAGLQNTWRVLDGEREVLAMPVGAVLRSIMLNHWYHHRGQLSVYLRELEVPVPSIYGPSADENPFATPQAATVA
jgi:uncharacterized damage-inducible protein DinB